MAKLHLKNSVPPTDAEEPFKFYALVTKHWIDVIRQVCYISCNLF